MLVRQPHVGPVEAFGFVYRRQPRKHHGDVRLRGGGAGFFDALGIGFAAFRIVAWRVEEGMGGIGADDFLHGVERAVKLGRCHA